MRDYWLTQDLLKTAGFGFLALSFLGIVLALWLPKKWWAKLLALVVVAFLIAIPVREGVKEVKQEHAQADVYKERLAKAQALFAERCKTAGEKIYKKVDNVEGIFLMKIRPKEDDFQDQFKLNDPYGSDLGGDGYIESFLRGSFKESMKDVREGPPRIGYLYVEALDSKDGQRYKYTGRLEEPWLTDKHFLKGYIRFVHDTVPATDKSPRYGVTYDDISTHEEREYWIAGSSLKVIDLQTNEVIAERIGYMVDWGQGSTGGFRSPWLEAANNACPDFHRNFKVLTGRPGPATSSQPGQTLDFVEKVLKPAK